MDTNNKSNIQEDSNKKNTFKKVSGIIFCVIILTLSCFIYIYCKEAKTSQASMYETEQQQTCEMTEYLSGIDGSVSSNMEHLAQAAIVQADTEKTLKEVTNTLSGMEEQITAVEKALTDTVIENTTFSTTSINKPMSETKTELLKQIETGNKEIGDILSSMNDANENNFQQTYIKIESLQETLDQVSHNMESYYKDLAALTKELQEENTEEHREILEVLLKAQEELNVLHNQITFADAHAKLQDIIIKFKEAEEANHTETLNVLQVMESDMQENIFSNFSSANSRIESSFQTASETLNQNFQDMKGSMAQNFTDLNTNIITKNDEMVQNINNNVDEKVTNLTAAINNYNESNGDNLEELKNYFKEQLTQVFTSVSNGKASLASALLTKGIDLGKEDATFTEIYNGIMGSPAVDPSIAATADNISNGKGAWVNGELIIGNGNDVNNAYLKGIADGFNNAMDNCSVSYVYHEHQGDPNAVGGCYAQVNRSCTTYMTVLNFLYTETVWREDLGKNIFFDYYNLRCPTCGYTTVDWIGGGELAAGQAYRPHSVTSIQPVCGKTTSTIESATITFS